MAFAVRQTRDGRVVFRKVKDLDSLIQEGIRQGFLELMRDLFREANRAVLKDPKTGRVYRIPGRSRRHRASHGRDTAHANLTGMLRRSISFKVKGHDRATFGYGVTGNAPAYARWVEFGTPKMAPRKTLRNAIAKVDTEAAFDRGLERMLKQVVKR